MATEEALVAIGTEVEYHGSIQKRHGRAVVTNVHSGGYVFPDGTGGTRYTLKYGQGFSEYMVNVRRVSFTPLEEF